jgi:hypothetical protein
MISVKGMTWGTPEFIAVTKKAEEVGRADDRFAQLVEEVCEMVNEDEMSSECFRRNLAEIKDTFDLYEGDEF